MICPICQVGTMKGGVCDWCGAPTQVRENAMRAAGQHALGADAMSTYSHEVVCWYMPSVDPR